MKTAVEWLVEQLNYKYGNDDFIITYINEIEQAKEMEKQKDVKYNEMLKETLDLWGYEYEGTPHYKKIEQLIKETTEI